MEIREYDAKALREVNEIIARLETVVDPLPSVLANLRSFQKIRCRILAKYESENDPETAARELSTADYLAIVRGG